MHPVLQQVRSVSHRARRLSLCVVFSRWLSVVALVTAVLALADYGFRFREAPLRWLLLCGLVGIAVWRWRKSVAPAIAERWSDHQVAQWIERGIPDLRERLSSAVSFLRSPAHDARYGSDTLRADVVHGTAVLIAERDLASVLDTRPARRALTAVLVLGALLGALCALDPESAGRALRRLAMPWGAEAWPRQHRLKFTRRPEILTRGQDFEVEVIDENGRPPADVAILYWFIGDDEDQIRAQRMTRSGGKLVHRLPDVTSSFRYRAVGGDDREMPWTDLRVVVPPRMVTSRITVRPPAYSGLGTATQERRIRALAGSSVEWDVEFDQPLSSAMLVLRSGNSERSIPALVIDGGKRCKVSEVNGSPLLLTASGTYTWELTDPDGVTMTVAEGTEVEVIPDLPPVVSVQSPADGADFTPRAIVPLRLQIKDDLAVQRVELHQAGASRVLAEFSLPAEGVGADGIAGMAQQIEGEWDLASIPNLQPGSALAFEFLAHDFRPQASQPAGGTIHIISDHEFQQRLDREQASLLRQLMAALQLERTVHQQTGAMLTQVESDAGLRPEDAAIWEVILPAQRRVAGMLEGQEGVLGQVQRLLATLATNRWEVAELAAHLGEVERRVREMATQQIPPIVQQLSDADRSLRFDPPDRGVVADSWSEAVNGQERLVADLESLVDLLGQWNRFRNLSDEVRQALDDHAEIGMAVDQLSTAGRDLSELSPEERSQLEQLSRRLSDLAGQIERLQLRLDQLGQRLSQSNPAAAKTLQDGLQVLEGNPVSGGLRQAGKAVAENRLGSAARDLESTRRGLEKLLAALEQQPLQSALQIEQQLIKTLTALATRQTTVVEETTVWGQQPAGEAVQAAARELAVRQADLAKETDDLARSLPASSGYALALEFASRPMHQASRLLAERQVDNETVQTERRALDFLKDVIASLAADAEAPPPQQPQEKSSAPPEDAAPADRQPTLAELKLMRLVQLEILQRTAELETKRTSQPEWSAEQRQELEQLSGRQRRLAELLESWDAPVEPSPGQAEPKPDSSSLPDHRSRSRPSRTTYVLVTWSTEQETVSQSPEKTAPRPPGNPIDRSLLDDLPPARPTEKSGRPAGEDVGQPSRDATPVAELGRHMRHIESLLQAGDTSATTQQLQRRVAAQLSTLIEQQQQQQQEQQPAQPDQPPPNDMPSSPGSQPAAQPGSGTGKNRTDQQGLSNWASGVWGVLPDRVREQIQDLSDEQFLPEYEQVIRDYYRRLSEKGK